MSMKLMECCMDAFGTVDVTRAEALSVMPKLEFWRVVVDEDTGEPVLDESGEPVMEPIDKRTKQAFADETDVNKILQRHQKQGTLDHLSMYEGVYGDFSDIDSLLDAHNKYNRGVEIFAQLPSNVRKDFEQSPKKFFEFVNDPANSDKLKDLLPELAKPGSYFPDVSSATPPGALLQEPKKVDVDDPKKEEPKATDDPVQST